MGPAGKRVQPWDTWLVLLCLASQLSGIEGDLGRNPAHQVHGVLGRSVLLPVPVSPTKKVSEIEWSFQIKSGEMERFVWFRNGALEYIEPPSLLVQRVEMANETSLRIKELKMGDSRVYKAHVKFASAKVQDDTFKLTVHEPVPEPQLFPQLLSSTPDGCNMTVLCQMSGKGEFNVSWKGGSPLRTLEEGSDWYQISDNGTNLHLFWKPNPADLTFFCLASNAAEQKNASFSLLSFCHGESESGANILFFWVRIFMLVGLVVQIFTIAWINILDRKDQKQS